MKKHRKGIKRVKFKRKIREVVIPCLFFIAVLILTIVIGYAIIDYATDTMKLIASFIICLVGMAAVTQ